jgi:hypothetical protein
MSFEVIIPDQQVHRGIRSALKGGAFSIIGLFAVSLTLTGLFVFAGASLEVSHWMSLLSNTFRLIKSKSITSEHFELIFIFSVVVSIFAQGTVQAYFRNNRFYEYTRLGIIPIVQATWVRWRVFPIPTLRKGWLTRRGPRDARPIAETLFVGGLMVLLASLSIIFVSTKSFYMHLLSTLGYLLIVTVIDLAYWLMTIPGPEVHHYRDDRIPAQVLFSEFNRQLLLRIDFGIIVVAIIPIIRLIGAFNSPEGGGDLLVRVARGFTAEPSIEEVAFFTGVASFYLVSTLFLIFNLLEEFNNILKKKHVIDAKLGPPAPDQGPPA